ncbi:MAG: hypothetical protein M1305_03845 [Candidatus Marsarchaeota archaeon]|nr:hypothetical protein [Candidatus Marsarchaeota archaeon]MDA8081601.1 hypothetical protein [Actinomycetota bacterium]
MFQSKIWKKNPFVSQALKEEYPERLDGVKGNTGNLQNAKHQEISEMHTMLEKLTL